MKFSVSLKENHLFRRAYSKGKNAVSPYLALYCRKNGSSKNRLGITVTTKLGKAVIRNKIRRRLREAYRLNESKFSTGYDIVVVARFRSVGAPYALLEADLLRLGGKLGITK